MKLVIACFVGSAAAAFFAALRMIEDGHNGEIVAAITLVAASVLFAGGAVAHQLERQIDRRLE